MCIILTCHPYTRPDESLLKTCFYNNPDGAGLMWVQYGMVQTSKGYMTLESLKSAIDSVPKTSPLVIHMRIATSGGVDVGTCHPFPVCSDIGLLHESDVECKCAIAHNGVIKGLPTINEPGVSDTVEFVSTFVNDIYHESGMNKSVIRRIASAAPGNRFAALTSEGRIFRAGDGWETVTKGIEASNSTWRWSWATKDVDWYGSSDIEDPLIEDFDYMCGDCPRKQTCIQWGAVCDEVYDYVETIYPGLGSGTEFAYEEDEILV